MASAWHAIGHDTVRRCARYRMRSISLVLVAAGVLAAGVGYAQSGADVLKAKGCLNCHEMDKKKVGPAYKDVAAKYKGKKNAAGAAPPCCGSGP